MTNYQLYDLGKKYKQYFDNYDQYIPPRINYYLNQNFLLLKKEIQNLDKQKLYIWQHYGHEENGKIIFPQSKISAAEKDFNELMQLESVVKFHLIPLSWFSEELTFTTEQMETLIPMIDENK